MTLVRHLAIIPDGNRRWARARGLSPEQGHAHGISAFTPLIQHAFQHGVETFTFWWGSPANLQRRSRSEVAAIVASLAGWLEQACPELLRAFDCQLELLGRWQELCPELGQPLAKAQAASGQGARRIVVLMAYDGREELVAAVKTAADAGASADFPARLWTAHLPPVDLLIRTGNSSHLSAGFMLWSIAEARLAFPSLMWPDMTADELGRVLTEAGSQERRYGA